MKFVLNFILCYTDHLLIMKILHEKHLSGFQIATYESKINSKRPSPSVKSTKNVARKPAMICTSYFFLHPIRNI
jgi:hypothetical protein